jgi:hypothetical protein
MTEDDIMQAAREAGPLTQGPFDKWCQRFAALVAAAEREAYVEKIQELEDFITELQERT